MSKAKIDICKVLFCIVLLYIILCNLGKLNQICVIDDEFGYWGVGAYFAGYDWTGLTPTSPYYGYGLGFLYMFLFKIFNNATIMYKAAIVLNSIFLLAAYFLSVKCGKKMYPEIEEKYVVLFCSFIALYPNTIVQSQVGWTESLLYLWFWVCCFLFINVSEKPSCVNSSLFAVVLSYGYMVHQRTLGVIIVAVLTVSMVLLVHKNSKRGFFTFIAIFAIGTMTTYCIKKYLSQNFWLTLDESVANINNIGGQIGKVQYIFSKQGIYDLILGCLGKALYLVFSTYGLILVTFTTLISYVMRLLKNIFLCKEKKAGDIITKEYYALFLLLSFLSTFAISAIFMISYSDRLDILLYGRYNEFLIGPLLLVACMKIKEHVEKKERKILIWIGCILLLNVLLVKMIPKNQFSAFHGMNAIGISQYFASLTKAEYVPFRIVVLSLIIIELVVLIQKNKKRSFYMWVAIFFGVALLGWYPTEKYNADLIYGAQKAYSVNAKDVAEYIRTEKTNSCIEYVVGENDTGLASEDLYDRYIKYVQFYLYDRKIDMVKESEINGLKNNNTIFIVRKESEAYKGMSKKFSLEYQNDLYGIFSYDL